MKFEKVVQIIVSSLYKKDISVAMNIIRHFDSDRNVAKKKKKCKGCSGILAFCHSEKESQFHEP